MIKKIICEKCAHAFNYMNIKNISRILDKDLDVREEYYKCPKCGTKHTTLVTDPEVRRLISIGDRVNAKARETELREQYLKKG